MKMFICCLLGGWFGLHKFIEHKKGLGILYIFTFGLCGIGWGIDTLIYLIRWLKKRKKAVSVSTIEQLEDEYIFLSFKVAGVTYKNGRKTRQAILRAFKWDDEVIYSIDFEQYEYDGRPAFYVKLNDKIVGNIPSDTSETFIEYEQKYKRDKVTAEVYGGNKLDDGSRSNYGCEVYIRYLKDA